MKSAENVADIVTNLRRFLNEATAAHHFATFGLTRLADFFDNRLPPPPPENPDPMFFFGAGDPSDSTSHPYAALRRSEARRQIERDGPVEVRLGQQWLVTVYTAWEHEYRPRLAEAHGCASADALCFPLLGDLRLLRNDVVHHHGIATRENTGKCITLSHWFRAGEIIALRGEHFSEFMRLFPWSDLANKPGSE